jgi:RNA polymerase sigma-70 factor, ECF subfamily
MVGLNPTTFPSDIGLNGVVKVMTEQEENELVLSAQRGEVLAFEELVRAFDRQVLSLALSIMQNEEDAKDIYQEVFIRVYRALPKFRFESRFSTWLHRIVTNVCLTQRSRRKRYEHMSLDQETEGSRPLAETLADRSSTDSDTMNLEITTQVQHAMQALSPQQKLVFTLRHFEGCKLREIAARMNCAEGTVKKYLFTATERLREQLKEVF